MRQFNDKIKEGILRNEKEQKREGDKPEKQLKLGNKYTALSSRRPTSLKQTPTCCISASLSRNLLELIRSGGFENVMQDGDSGYIPDSCLANVEDHSYLFFIQDLYIVVLGQSVSHGLGRNELCRDLGDDLWTCAHQAFSQHNNVSYCVQVLDCDVELLMTSEPMDSFQLSYWDDALVLRDGLDGPKKSLVGYWNEDGVLLEDGRTDVFKGFGQNFHSFHLV